MRFSKIIIPLVVILALMFVFCWSGYLPLPGSEAWEVTKAEASGTQQLGDLEIGDKVVDLSWEWEHRTGNDYSYVEGDETKPVIWIVVAKNHYYGGDGGSIVNGANHITLISEDLICKYRFDNSNNRKTAFGDNNWGDSGSPNATKGIRKFLNGSSYQGNDVNTYDFTFYDAMSISFQDAILVTTIPTGWGLTNDKIFLPSARELGQEYGLSPPLQADWGYFTDDSNRIAVIKSENWAYWTRSPNGPGNISWYVNSNGVIFDSNLVSDYRSWVGVRPALNLSSDILVSGIANDDGAYEIIPPSAYSLKRLSGANRYQTAISISKDSYPAAKSADAVVIARGDEFADALPGGVLAYKENGPLLLTSSQELIADVETEISRVLKDSGTIYILGGTSAISSAVESQLQEMASYTVDRIAGINRTETAYKIAQKVGDYSSQAIIAYSRNFPDALAISSYAAREGIPILTSGTDTLSADAEKYLTDYNVDKVYVVGGSGVISAQVYSQIEDIVDDVERFGGANRYETARLIADKFFPAPTLAALVYGRNFPDALAGGVNAARYNAPIMLVEKNSIPSEIEQYLQGKKDSLNSIVVYGGPAVISNEVMIEAEDLIQ